MASEKPRAAARKNVKKVSTAAMTVQNDPVSPGKFLDAHQRATIEAAMARIIPTDDQPGAKEARNR